MLAPNLILLGAGAPPDAPPMPEALGAPGASETWETPDPNDPRSDGEASDPGRISTFGEDIFWALSFGITI